MINNLSQLNVPWREAMEAQRGVIELGGQPRPETHRPEVIRDYKGGAAGGKTCGCSLPARATMPYRREDKKPGFVNFCMVCDAGARFPRVQAATQAAKDAAEIEEAPDAERG